MRQNLNHKQVTVPKQPDTMIDISGLPKSLADQIRNLVETFLNLLPGSGEPGVESTSQKAGELNDAQNAIQTTPSDGLYATEPNSDEDDLSPWRGIFVIEPEYPPLFELNLTVQPHQLPRWEPTFTLSERWLRNDDE